VLTQVKKNDRVLLLVTNPKNLYILDMQCNLWLRFNKKKKNLSLPVVVHLHLEFRIPYVTGIPDLYNWFPLLLDETSNLLGCI
jgi:hypothetical protein